MVDFGRGFRERDREIEGEREGGGKENGERWRETRGMEGWREERRERMQREGASRREKGKVGEGESGTEYGKE